MSQATVSFPYTTNQDNPTRQTLSSAIDYSQLSRKRPPLVHGKVVAYERWSLTGKNQLNKPKPVYKYPSTNNNYNIAKIRQIDKAVPFKTNSFWVLQHVFCFVNALINSIAFEFGNQRKQTKISFFSCVGC